MQDHSHDDTNNRLDTLDRIVSHLILSNAEGAARYTTLLHRYEKLELQMNEIISNPNKFPVVHIEKYSIAGVGSGINQFGGAAETIWVNYDGRNYKYIKEKE
jgi:hypothetical protein